MGKNNRNKNKQKNSTGNSQKNQKQSDQERAEKENIHNRNEARKDMLQSKKPKDTPPGKGSKYNKRIVGNESMAPGLQQDKQAPAIREVQLGLMSDFRNTRISTLCDTNTPVYVYRYAAVDAETHQAALITAYANALYAVYDPTNQKDWVAGQETAWEQNVFYWVTYLVEYNIQAFKRTRARSITQDDATTYWEQASFDAEANAVVRMGMFAPKISIEIAKKFLVWFKLREADIVRGYPECVYVPFSNVKTLAQMRTLRDLIRANEGLAVLHAAKTNSPIEAVSIPMLTELMHEVKHESNEGLFYKTVNIFDAYDTVEGNENISITGNTNDALVAMTTDSTTCYTTFPVVFRDKEVIDLWAFAPMFFSNNANNSRGMVEIGAAGNTDGYLNVFYCDIDDTSFTAFDFDANLNARSWVEATTFIAYATTNYRTVYLSANNTGKLHLISAIQRDGNGMYATGLSQAEWYALADVAFIASYR